MRDVDGRQQSQERAIERPPAAPIDEIIAPDAIPVQPIPLPDSAFTTLAVGRIPPGQHGVHFHCTLEQVTYGLAGEVEVRTRSPEGVETVTRLLPGTAVVTAPLHTLSFANHGDEDARVLFVCVPPYPADHADTVVAGSHRALTRAELRRARRRQRQVQGEVARAFDERLNALRARLIDGPAGS